MNTNLLKRFAQDARNKLINQISAKLELVLTGDSAELREKATHIKKLQEAINSSSKAQVIDKVAYTWFNRFMALRFMDVNGYQPINIQVVSPKTGYTLPELLDEAKQGNIPEELNVKRQHIYDVLDGNIKSSNAQNEVYKELLIGACNHLHTVFPFLFEKINDYTELLLPEDLTSEFSILQNVRDGMTAEDCQEVEIIGWLYQFYISEKKDEVFASKSKVKKEDIPAATQLFTPRWIVEYMVQNTVGKLWLQNNPNSKLRDHMQYFIESPSVASEDYLKINSPEEITLLDQACGSGHILVYGFELLSKIYEEEGYNPSEIPQLIIEKNLFGFEIDERAAQLAGMALLMKARSYQRRVFRKTLQPNILCYQDVKLADEDLGTTFKQLDIKLTEELKHDLKIIEQATNLGSLIKPHTDTKTLKTVLEAVETKQEETTDIFLKGHFEHLYIALKQLILLSKKYHCIVDNPPYMGGGKMNKILSDYVKTNYPSSKADLMTCFMEAGWSTLLTNGIIGMINLPSWLFISSFEKIRKKLLQERHIDSLLHMGRGIFGADWGSTAFIIKNGKSQQSSHYFRLFKNTFSQYISPEDISSIFLRAKSNPDIRINFSNYKRGNELFNIDELIDKNGEQVSFLKNQKEFLKIPGNNIAYWLSPSIIDCFKINSIKNYGKAKAGIVSGNDSDFIRFWSEVPNNRINFKPSKFLKNGMDVWVPINKGGDFKKYAGNDEHVINIKNLWADGRTSKSVRRGDVDYYYKEAITWNYVTSVKPSFRISNNKVFATASPAVFLEDKSLKYYLLGLLNSSLSELILDALNPTLNLVSGDVERIPVIVNSEHLQNIESFVKDILDISQVDWDSRERSYGFQKNYLLKIEGQDLEEIYDLWVMKSKSLFYKAKRIEESINTLFCDTYNLSYELISSIELEHVTILKEESIIKNNNLLFNSKEVFSQFVSYAVGCMFGRYSLDKPGLILANQGETLEDYLNAVGSSATETSFMPDDDNIIPILDDEWFEDDIVGRFYEFLKVSFGTENFDTNLAFVEECLGKDIRKYFVKDFYKDHIKRYKKRPIYWQFSSPKGSFNVLIYMHRYTPDTLNEILNGYLVEYREKLKTRTEQLDHLIETGSSTEQTKAAKEKDKLKIVLLELQEYERDTLYPLATERIAIDLDDGVLVNYNKFGTAVKKVTGLNDDKAKAKVRKFDWIDVETIK